MRAGGKAVAPRITLVKTTATNPIDLSALLTTPTAGNGSSTDAGPTSHVAVNHVLTVR